MPVWLSKMVLAPAVLHILLQAGNEAQQSLTPDRERVYLKWSDCCSLFLVGPRGLVLLVVCHLFAVPILVLWVELKK